MSQADKTHALKGPAAGPVSLSGKGIKHPAAKTRRQDEEEEELSEGEARRQLARLAEDDYDDEYDDEEDEEEDEDDGVDLGGPGRMPDGGGRSPPPIRLTYEGSAYYLISSPTPSTARSVLLTGRLELLTRPVVHLLHNLVTAFTIEQDSDVQLVFPRIELIFPIHMTYTHNVTLERILEYHSAASGADDGTVECVLEVTSPGFVERFNALEAMCKGRGDTSRDAIEIGSESEGEEEEEEEGRYDYDEYDPLGTEGGDGLIGLEFAAEVVGDEYSEADGADAEAVGELFADDDRKRKKPRWP